MKMYHFRFQVISTAPGHFPFDMLRYDGCYPASEHPDSATLEEQYTPGGLPKGKTVTLCKCWSDPKWQPTVDRWRSFGWDVVTSSLEIAR